MKDGTEIIIDKTSQNQVIIFNVTVKDQNSQTTHRVSLNKTDYIRITQGHVEPEKLIEKSFEFLLEQEAKEEILKSFDFTTINRYFPNFKDEIQKRMDEL